MDWNFIFFLITAVLIVLIYAILVAYIVKKLASRGAARIAVVITAVAGLLVGLPSVLHELDSRRTVEAPAAPGTGQGTVVPHDTRLPLPVVKP